MRRMHLATLALIAGVSAATACGNSDSNGGGSGGGSANTGGTSGSGGTTASGGAKGSGGMTGTGGVGTGGALSGASGGSSTTGSGGSVSSGGSNGSGGSASTGGRPGGSGGDGVGGAMTTGGRGGGSAGATGTAGRGGVAGRSGSGGTSATGGSSGGGTCTASKAASANATGTGPHKVVVETNSGGGINEGTIFRPMDLGGAEKYPIFVWGEGGCSQNGLSNSVALAEIASHGYFVIADGAPNGSSSRSMNSSDPAAMGKPLLAYVTWAIEENGKSCSAYYGSLDTAKVAANGFSCGGLMAEGTVGDPRITTWGLNSSGLLSANASYLKTVHTPVLIVLGGSGDVAYANGERDYDTISALGVPIMLFSKALGHGGDLFGKNGGDFTKIDLAWLNWQLKGDETATGKGLLVGSSCPYCTDSAWEVKSKNIP